MVVAQAQRELESTQIANFTITRTHQNKFEEVMQPPPPPLGTSIGLVVDDSSLLSLTNSMTK